MLATCCRLAYGTAQRHSQYKSHACHACTAPAAMVTHVGKGVLPWHKCSACTSLWPQDPADTNAWAPPASPAWTHWHKHAPTASMHAHACSPEAQLPLCRAELQAAVSACTEVPTARSLSPARPGDQTWALGSWACCRGQGVTVCAATAAGMGRCLGAPTLLQLH